MGSSVDRPPRLARDVFGIFTGRTLSMSDLPAPFSKTWTMSRLLRRDQPISRRVRLAAGAVVLLGALAAGCSQIPEVSISTEQLKQLASDAKDQVEVIAADAKTIGAQLGTLPATAREKAQQAVDAATSASQQAQSALESAQQSQDGAQQKIDDAKTALDDASTKLADLTSSAGDAVTPQVQSAIDALSAQIAELKASVDDVAS